VNRSNQLRALAGRLEQLLGSTTAAGLYHVAELLDEHPPAAVQDSAALVAELCEAMAARGLAAVDERLKAASQIWTIAARLLRAEPPPLSPPARSASRLEELELERARYDALLCAVMDDEVRLAAERVVYARLLHSVEDDIEALRRAPS
jgi:hypothetical protein